MAITIAVIGDRFIRSSLLRAALEKELPRVDDIDWVTDEHDWPDTPMRHDDEISEYTGDPAQVAQRVAEADVALVHMAAMHRRVLESANQLRCINCSRAGAINVNLSAARERDIVVTNAPGRNARAVAEFTLGALLAHTRGIVGFGHVGGLLAKILAPFGSRLTTLLRTTPWLPTTVQRRWSCTSCWNDRTW